MFLRSYDKINGKEQFITHNEPAFNQTFSCSTWTAIKFSQKTDKQLSSSWILGNSFHFFHRVCFRSRNCCREFPRHFTQLIIYLTFIAVLTSPHSSSDQISMLHLILLCSIRHNRNDLYPSYSQSSFNDIHVHLHKNACRLLNNFLLSSEHFPWFMFLFKNDEDPFFNRKHSHTHRDSIWRRRKISWVNLKREQTKNFHLLFNINSYLLHLGGFSWKTFSTPQKLFS